MKTDIGEYIVGAYLKIIKGCDIVDYNVRRPGGHLEGLNEIDVLGLDFTNSKAYLCEVTTHIQGVLYKDYNTTLKKVENKHENLKNYAAEHLKRFSINNVVYMFWAPVVPKGISERLNSIKGLEIVINKDYTSCIDQLRKEAKKLTHDAGNPFFRTLQILEHLRR